MPNNKKSVCQEENFEEIANYRRAAIMEIGDMVDGIRQICQLAWDAYDDDGNIMKVMQFAFDKIDAVINENI